MESIEWLLSELEKVNYHPTEAMIMYAKRLHKQDKEISIALFLRWFTKHYTTTNDGQFFGWADSMGNDATMEQILDHYYKDNI